MNAFWQKFLWTVLAVGVIALAEFGVKDSASQHALLGLAGMMIGSVWVKRPGDAGALVALFAIGVSVQGCSYAKPACDVVKIAGTACDILLVDLPDGGAEPVPKSEIQQLAMRRQAVRQQSTPVDGGYGQ